jgi:hypothetical protein
MMHLNMRFRAAGATRYCSKGPEKGFKERKQIKIKQQQQ